jgi:hypothetical protein
MNLSMDDMMAIVKPHNDKLIAEGRTAELLAALKSSRWTIVSLMNLHCPDAGIGQLCIENIDAAIARAEGFEG